MRYCLALTLLSLALTGCTPVDPAGEGGSPPPEAEPFAADPAPRPVTAITIEETPCFGFCPAFTARIAANGQGTYEGGAFVATKGAASFTVSPAEFAAFEQRLAPFRLARTKLFNHGNCTAPLATDSPSVKVTWEAAGREPVVLDWYLGCRQPGLTERSDDIYDAWKELPALAELVGEDQNRQAYRD